MEGREFSDLAGGSLLRDVEEVVVEAHRGLYAAKGKPWSRPIAYHWLRYENPDPVARLADGIKRLRKEGAEFGPSVVDKACAEASKGGFLN